ncbi:hypothetical protein B1778_00875 [Dehalococcoides mccartyi]|uniref:PD-(D/E)XK nuclease family protein n=1 Tax=Dehalococcoides mccartyi TaxID=61435 RepID=UPI00098EE902|nr:PD-(D/E)XK nuclease family protein [Dehalococcoides mccartyi]AQU05324.1 hypothetical protein B1777_01020 [Dehalococcoides mccartyi]AQU06777.1 hypothetical protein B1778_00875 [Dehalococcoides mccartyi]
MNILRILTLNKHGDFEEVLFSSALSYLLDPKQDHGLGSRFLEKITKEAFPNIDRRSLNSAIVQPESTLGKAGNVDLLITLGEKVLAIEVKIWDRSARNISKDGHHQVERYCGQLAYDFRDKDWSFIFLIPTLASPQCMKEFKAVCDGDHQDRVKVMPWCSDNSIEIPDIPERNISQTSIQIMLTELMGDISRVDLPLNTLWLVDSLSDIIPDLVERIPEQGRFPVKSKLTELPTWPIFDALLAVEKRWPIPMHTTIGIPYGSGDQKADIHGNSLYRIRTVTDYYTECSEMENHLPYNQVEIEIWPDVYEVSKERIMEWLEGLGLDSNSLRADVHLDSGKREQVMVLSLPRDLHLREEQVEDLHHILKEGFRVVSKSKEY